MSTIRDLITNPSKIIDTTLNTVNYNYWATLHQSLIVIKDDCWFSGNQSMVDLHTPAFNLSQQNFTISSLWYFTRMQLTDISMPTVHFTVFVCIITGLECTPTLSKCAMHVQVALLQTLPKANHPNWYTTSPSRRHFWFFLLMLILQGSILASMVPRFTSSHAVACQDLHPWNWSSMLTPKTLHRESWKFNCAIDSATQLFWIRTANSLVFAAKPLTSCT